MLSLRPFVPLIAAALLAATIGGCATGKGKGRSKEKRKPAAAKPADPLEVGTVALVNEKSQFILIDTGTQGAPPAGAVLKTYTGKIATGEVVASDVRKHPHVIADIRHGLPKKGDRVLYDRVQVQAEPTTASRTASPVQPEEEEPGAAPHAGFVPYSPAPEEPSFIPPSESAPEDQ